jgi:hypothetical protein
MPEKTVDAYIKALPAKQREVATAIRRLVSGAAPDATESVRWGQPVFTDHGPFAYMKKASAHLTFGFWRGAELDGGRGILEGTGARMAHVKIADLEDIDQKQLTALIKAAVKLNREKGDPTKR